MNVAKQTFFPSNEMYDGLWTEKCVRQTLLKVIYLNLNRVFVHWIGSIKSHDYTYIIYSDHTICHSESFPRIYALQRPFSYPLRPRESQLISISVTHNNSLNSRYWHGHTTLHFYWSMCLFMRNLSDAFSTCKYYVTYSKKYWLIFWKYTK